MISGAVAKGYGDDDVVVEDISAAIARVRDAQIIMDGVIDYGLMY